MEYHAKYDNFVACFMIHQLKIGFCKGFLILNAMVLLGSFVGSSYVNSYRAAIVEEEASKTEEGEQSTGSASFHLISYEAIVPGFHFYIPIIPVMVFEIKIETPYASLPDLDELPLIRTFLDAAIGSVICPNAP